MAKNRVCGVCGKRIDTNKEGYYDRHRQIWVCHRCGKQEIKDWKEAEADEREKKTGMRQTQGAMIAKIAVGALFIISAFATSSFGAVLTGIVIGLALIAWGLLPWLLPRLKEKKDADAAAAAALAEAERLANEPKVCSACGAHTKGNVCEYCGAPLK